MIRDDERRIYGVLYEIKGAEAASTLQFYVTDSLSHFLRGALYFNVSPNNDSLAPVIDFIEEDIRHMIGTLNWENRRR
jgi:gliding motility-associated lipoprotein GldD